MQENNTFSILSFLREEYLLWCYVWQNVSWVWDQNMSESSFQNLCKVLENLCMSLNMVWSSSKYLNYQERNFMPIYSLMEKLQVCLIIVIIVTHQWDPPAEESFFVTVKIIDKQNMINRSTIKKSKILVTFYYEFLLNFKKDIYLTVSLHLL